MAEPDAGNGLRPAVCAGSWYPGRADALRAGPRRVPCGRAADCNRVCVRWSRPHAGLMYSGPVAGHAYAAVSRAALRRRGARWTVTLLRVRRRGPLGPRCIRHAARRACHRCAARRRCCARRRRSSAKTPPSTSGSTRWNCSCRFWRGSSRTCRFCRLLVGHQRAATVAALGEALARVLRGREALLVASSDLSHYQDAGDGGAAGCGRHRPRRALRSRRPAGEPRGRPVPRMRRADRSWR